MSELPEQAEPQELSGITELPVAEQISRYRALHDSLVGRLADEAE